MGRAAAGGRRGLEDVAAGRAWMWWRPRCGGAGPRSACWVRCWTGWPGGRPAVVLIEGEAGIGKTRLLGTALEDARARGMQVAWGRAEELELHRPFGLVAAAFGCGRSSADPRRAAIADLLARHAARRGPVPG